MNLVHVYFGLGKGKTTAALGLALRSAGHGKKIVIVQFLKGGHTGELGPLSSLNNITVLRGQAGPRFSKHMTLSEREKTCAIHNENLKTAIELIDNNECDLLVLDEALDALQMNMLDEAPLRRLLEENPLRAEIVITGHRGVEWIKSRADYATEMVKVKHPYDNGIKARVGIEY